MNEQTHPFSLAPVPRRLTPREGTVTLPQSGYIVAAPALHFAAKQIKVALGEQGFNWQIAAAPTASHGPRIILALTNTLSHPQAYRVNIDSQDVFITGSDVGVLYGAYTVCQLIQQYGVNVPQVLIDDWPDFPARGVMIDCSRDKVPTMETLFDLIDMLARFKVNQLQLYIEHTFAYSAHEEVWAAASPFTAEEIQQIEVYCRQRHIDLVPNQNSLGHMERWLKFDRYKDLAECPDGFEIWGERRSASTLNPLDPRSIELIEELYDELLPNFTSKLFNVGCDEPWELGEGRTREALSPNEKKLPPELKGRVYLDWLLKLHKLCTARGVQMQFWGDIIIHHPELIPELPKDAIAMEWGYESTHDFAGHGKLFADSGIPYYVCPGTSSWNSLIGRTENAIGNLRGAAKSGLENGAIGYLNTDWGDLGHFQPLSSAYLGFVYGAAVSWCVETNENLDLPTVMNRYVFRDAAELMGQLVYDLGNVYKRLSPHHINGQLPAYALTWPQELMERRLANNKGDLSDEAFQESHAAIDAIVSQFDQTQMQRPDAEQIKAELTQAANMTKHGLSHLMFQQEVGDIPLTKLQREIEALIATQQATWLARHRPGGLSDSLARLELLKDIYKKRM